MFSNGLKILLLATILIMNGQTTNLYAHGLNDNFFKQNQHFVLDLGAFKVNQGKAQHIGINGLIGDYFTLHKHNDQNVLIGLGYYLDAYQTPCGTIQYGIHGFYFPETEVNGTVIQENLFTNLGYHYRITNIPIYLSTKGFYQLRPAQQLTASLGLGVNILSARRFKEFSLNAFTLPDHPFSNRTQTPLSATISIGWRFENVYNNMPVEIAYRFFYLNQGRFDKHYQVENSLKTGNSYANALTISTEIG